MQSAVKPKPVAAMLATIESSVLALRALQRSFTNPVSGTGLFEKIAAVQALEFVEKLVVFRGERCRALLPFRRLIDRTPKMPG